MDNVLRNCEEVNHKGKEILVERFKDTGDLSDADDGRQAQTLRNP